MMKLINLTESIPVSEYEHMLVRYGAAILRDEEGHEWYTSQSLFAPDTLKVVYDKELGSVDVLCSSFILTT
ncbi:hypothetical protein J8V57_17850 [Xenorhabdus sp. PB61.4]|uniref:hypothetical protein n=1 Tax=Xenorhabdus sp. PB61.4 TaxID=2788940 RepID=UPI001E2A10BE|nr:hypothetical protein [Xenorhabdus sp. PB61.4]MCC8368095.1 hypothetical protein [Xenorhabdus sp. PB61.4]